MWKKQAGNELVSNCFRVPEPSSFVSHPWSWIGTYSPAMIFRRKFFCLPQKTREDVHYRIRCIALLKKLLGNFPLSFNSWSWSTTIATHVLQKRTEGSPIYIFRMNKTSFDHILARTLPKIDMHNHKQQRSCWSLSLDFSLHALDLWNCTTCDAVKIQHIQDSAFCWSRLASTIQLIMLFMVRRIVPSSLSSSRKWCGKLKLETEILMYETDLWNRCVCFLL